MVRVFGRGLRYAVALLSLLFVQSLMAAATITVQSDRNPVSMNESFRLIFEADGSVDSAPDFTPLKQDFEILRQSSGTSMQIINGEVSQKRTWTVVMMPKRPGRLVVPPVQFGSDQSRPLVIGVKAAAESSSEAQDSALFIEVGAEPENPYVQGQLLYTVRLFRAINIANASLSEPQLSGDAVVEKLGEDREFETTRNGRRYVVLERSYAIFPQQSGELAVAPVVFEGQVVNRARGMFDVFDQAGPVRRVRSEAVKVDVQPVPVSEQQQQWLPAKEVRLIEEWPEGVDLSQAIEAGEPLTWTLTLIADGVAASQLPTVVPEMPDGLKAYPDQAKQLNERKPNTLIGVRQEKVALIPTQAGEYRIPAIEIPWWNSVSGKREIARLPARTLLVTGVAQVEDESSGLPVVDLSAVTNHLPASTTAVEGGDDRWRIISALLAIGWLLTVAAWLFSRRRAPRDAESETAVDVAPDFGEVKASMREACRGNNPEAAKTALLVWARLNWKAHPPGSLGELARRVADPLKSDIQALNQLLYRSSSPDAMAHWDGKEMWGHFSAEISSQRKPASGGGHEVLTPMYP